MAGSLIKIAETTISSAVASVTLTGIDSTYDVYMVAFNNVVPTTNASVLRERVTVSGTADTSANYDETGKFFRTNTTFSDISRTNLTYFTQSTNSTNSTDRGENAIYYLFNFNNSSEYSYTTSENSGYNQAGYLAGTQMGGVHTVAQSCDGIQFFYDNGSTIASGTFKLYGLKK